MNLSSFYNQQLKNLDEVIHFFMNYEDFRADLRKMTLEDALIKHGLSFEEAVKNAGQPKVHVNSCKEKYISERNGKYLLRKQTSDGYWYVGSFYTLKDAVKVRDCFIENGWDKNELKNICEKLGVERV